MDRDMGSHFCKPIIARVYLRYDKPDCLHPQEWWTHLWLNEGFASWIEYLCVDHCFPEYDIWTQFANTDYTRALDLDALKNSHPIEVGFET